MDDVPVLDLTRLELITRGSSARAREFLEALFEETDAQLERLNALLAGRDGIAVSDVAHTIKGTAMELGAMRLRAAAAALETESDAERWPTCIGNIASALAELRRAQTPSA